MEWLPPSFLIPSDQADVTCTLCKVTLLLKQWPSHVWTEDHQKRAYENCGDWNYLERSNIFVIYCNFPVQPISLMEYLRHNCLIELKDFILVPGKPTEAILQFHSSKEYMTFLHHSKQTKICCGNLIVTHAQPATEINESKWISLVNCDGPIHLNYDEHGQEGFRPIFLSPVESHSAFPGPSWSCQRLSRCPQRPESVRRLHQLAIDSGWPPPKFVRLINDRLAGKYTAKVTVNGKIFCSNILAGDYSTACKIVADNCLNTLEKENVITKTSQADSQTNPPPKIAPVHTPTDKKQNSAIPSSSSSSSSSLHPPPKPHPNTNTTDGAKTKKNSDATFASNPNFNSYRSQSPPYLSSRSTPSIIPAARISQPVKRKIIEEPTSSTDEPRTKRQKSLNDNNKISTAEGLMPKQLARNIPSPTKLFALTTDVEASTSQNIKTTKSRKPEIEVVYDERNNAEDATAQPAKICDGNGEILLVREVRKKPEEDLQNATVKVKTEKYASPWPKVYLHEDYIKSLEHPVDTLEKICLVCNWEMPSYDLVVSQSPIEEGSERFSYKMTLNEIEYKNVRVEKTKKRAKEKVSRICLAALTHNGEIPHTSVFMNVSLNPVKRLENLIISRRLPNSSQDVPKCTLIENLEEEAYYFEVTFNGKTYMPTMSQKTKTEAKEEAAEFCLQKLSSSMPLYADGSLTEKAKTVLMTMSQELPKINETDKEIVAKIENFKNQCKNIVTLMTITEEMWKSADAIVKKLKNLVPGLRAIMYRNWYMKLKSYTDFDRLFIFVFKTDDNKTVIPADPEEIEKRILRSSEQFPVLTVTKLASTNSMRFFKQREQRTESQSSFTLETDLNTLDEVHLCRLIHYISEFDSRFLPVLSLLRYWAKTNRVRFHPPDNSKMRNISGDPVILDLLLVSFLGGAGVIPTVSKLLQRDGTFSFRASKICLPSDIPYVNEWKSNGHAYQRNSFEFWLSVLDLTKNFFLYYADRFKEGSWVFNICDSEMIYCLDLFYGSFQTKLSPEKLKKLMVAEGLDREKIKKQSDSNDSRMYMMIPMQKNSKRWTNLNWGRMVDEMMECGSATIFDLMGIAGTRLSKFLDDFPQNHLDLESTLNCLS